MLILVKNMKVIVETRYRTKKHINNRGGAYNNHSRQEHGGIKIDEIELMDYI